MSASDSTSGLILREYLEGGLSPDMALMRLILATEDVSELHAALTGQLPHRVGNPMAAERLAELLLLATRHADAWPAVRATAAAVRHEHGAAAPETSVARLAVAFDRAARTSPEASVALYSFGKQERLDTATMEIVEWLDACGVLGPDRDLLDIGCGIGRLEARLHERVRSIVGIDVSPEMVSIARRRSAGLGNVEIRRTTGLGLEEFSDESFDCTLAVDTFPYLLLAARDLADHHVAEASRVLKPGGNLVVLNFSYGGSIDQDRLHLQRLAETYGFDIVLEGEQPFMSWDGAAFHLIRSHRQRGPTPLRTSGRRPLSRGAAGGIRQRGRPRQTVSSHHGSTAD